MMKKLNENNGVTLVALVITIIVLLILAGVTIAMLSGENGILTKAKEAKTKTDNASNLEKIELAILAARDNTGKFDMNLFKGELEKQNLSYEQDDDNNIISINTENKEYKIKNNGEIEISDSDGGKTPNTGTGVNVGNLFDKLGTEEGKLHIGDFINYSAGTWTETDMETIGETKISPNNSTDLPSNSYQFGGFSTGLSRDENATIASSYSNVVTDKKTNKLVAGWRLFDVGDDNIMLISAGCPEDYRHAYGNTQGHLSEYILRGELSGNLSVDSFWWKNSVNPRKWDMYVNKEEYKAIGASVLTKDKLNAWYSKYVTENANINDNTVFQKIYKSSGDCVNNGKYESLIDICTYYWFGNNESGSRLYELHPGNKSVNSGGGSQVLGVRVLVSLSSDVKLSEKAVDTKTVVSRGNEYIYNVWNLVKE